MTEGEPDEVLSRLAREQPGWSIEMLRHSVGKLREELDDQFRVRCYLTRELGKVREEVRKVEEYLARKERDREVAMWKIVRTVFWALPLCSGAYVLWGLVRRFGLEDILVAVAAVAIVAMWRLWKYLEERRMRKRGVAIRNAVEAIAGDARSNGVWLDEGLQAITEDPWKAATLAGMSLLDTAERQFLGPLRPKNEANVLPPSTLDEVRAIAREWQDKWQIFRPFVASPSADVAVKEILSRLSEADMVTRVAGRPMNLEILDGDLRRLKALLRLTDLDRADAEALEEITGKLEAVRGKTMREILGEEDWQRLLKGRELLKTGLALEALGEALRGVRIEGRGGLPGGLAVPSTVDGGKMLKALNEFSRAAWEFGMPSRLEEAIHSPVNREKLMQAAAVLAQAQGAVPWKPSENK